MIIIIIVFEMILIILLYRFSCNSYRAQGWISIHDFISHTTLKIEHAEDKTEQKPKP